MRATPAVPPEDTESLLAKGAQALHVDGDLRAAREFFDTAYRRAEEDDQAEAMAAAVVGLSGLWVQEQRTAAGVEVLLARLRRTLTRCRPGSLAALRVRVRLAGEHDYPIGAHEGMVRMLGEARRSDDPVACAEALSLAHHCVLGPEHGALRRDLAAELLGQSSRSGRRGDLLMGLLWQVADLFLAGDPHAERRLGCLRRELARRDHLAVRFVASAFEVMLAIRAGRFAEAEALASACAARGTAAGDVDATGWFGAQLMAIRWYQGRLPELAALIDEVARSDTLSPNDNSFFAALAVASALAGDFRAAAGAVAKLGDLDDLPRSSIWLVTVSSAAEAAFLLGDTDLAATTYRLLRPFAGLPVMASLGVACFGSAHHPLGVAALTTGDLDAAVAHFRAAVERNLAIGHWPAVVLSRLRYAQALTLRALPSDVLLARQHHDAALEEAAAMGMAVPDESRKPRPAVSCVRQDNWWRVELGRRVAVVDHCVGMAHLATLTANPGVEVPAVALIGSPGTERLAEGSRQPVLDSTALHQYRRRLARLKAELAAWDPDGEPADVRAEHDWLLAELHHGSGLGGRARPFADGGERARVAAGKAIRRALARISAADPAIGTHLRGTVHTGVRCSYRPAST
ncbi:hypothetical protein AMES_4724 [Amycolatopsis mediterranei S699]|uniref:Uncharacterized protein n=2 Tax=Amycolatopsis mediterranei TaxID=33910 RepID=A0A0H3DAH8_AMYMU|nr:hypothetical protein AMED_4783 [Amycolatopsis mediterranei U32]AEK43349.1 hypothetical protein RAM_24345 [Amycolatopsis mediterranei S699]AGT85388.1 hypothetical protein B737_4724 [Amycolatopsis mediterranei RB]KDO06206.1 hypothetical protein DV26_34850 [Amycolatopsis mediterranei]AFO78260.1 hypothetical protein AMES_4724 [Amycolatopsis mediterranei S699]